MTLSSEILPVCLECLRSGKEKIEAVIAEAHRHSRSLFQLADRPPRNASGKSCKICVNECQIPSQAGKGEPPEELFSKSRRFVIRAP
jgi:pyruvate formate lyase activating enzyme